MAAPLALLLMSTLAAQEGFGGAPAPAPPPPPRAEAPLTGDREGDACRVQLESGRWVSCAALLDDPSLSSSSERGGALAGVKRDATRERSTELTGSAERAPLAVPDAPGTVAVEVQEPDFAAQLERDRLQVPDGPWAEALKSAAEAQEPSSLQLLRRDVEILKLREAWFRRQVEARTRTAAQHEEVRQTLLAQTKRLADVEVLALRLRQRCASRRGLHDALPMSRVPVGIRLDLDQPVVKGLLLAPDPEGCQRDQLVTDEVMARIDELHTIEHRLKTEQFGYYRVRERRALEDRRKLLLDEVMGNMSIQAIEVIDGDSELKPLKPVDARDIPRAPVMKR